MREQTTYKIQPKILLFMRKSSGMSEDEIAKKLKLSRSEYLSIESGDEKISQNDLIHLADIYKRPLIAFYSVDTSQTTELPHDYRLNRDKKISPEVFLKSPQSFSFQFPQCSEQLLLVDSSELYFHLY